MQEYESVKQQLEKDGYKISNAELSEEKTGRKFYV